MGLLAACFVAVSVWVFLGSRAASRLHALPRSNGRGHADSISPAQARRTRAQRERTRLGLSAQAPVLADLMSAAISAGASVHDALTVVSATVDEPLKSRLEAVRASVALGAPQTLAWAPLLDDEALAPIASAVIRSAQTGATISIVLDAAAVDMRHAHRAQVEVAARSAGVRAVAPLALCFLPAFLLVGVVPVIAGFATALLS
jgi:Flp pilus assembly protein TadB